jgi:hypothetical protein
MVASVTAVLKRLKTPWATQWQPEALLAACEEAGDTSRRNRVLTPVTTLQRFLLQILHGKPSPLLGRWLRRLHARVPRRYSGRSASRRCSGQGAAFPWYGCWGCSTRAPGSS